MSARPGMYSCMRARVYAVHFTVHGSYFIPRLHYNLGTTTELVTHITGMTLYTYVGRWLYRWNALDLKRPKVLYVFLCFLPRHTVTGVKTNSGDHRVINAKYLFFRILIITLPLYIQLCVECGCSKCSASSSSSSPATLIISPAFDNILSRVSLFLDFCRLAPDVLGDNERDIPISRLRTHLRGNRLHSYVVHSLLTQ